MLNFQEERAYDDAFWVCFSFHPLVNPLMLMLDCEGGHYRESPWIKRLSTNTRDLSLVLSTHKKQSEHSAVGLERENPYGSLADQPSQMVKFQVPVRDPVSSNKVDSS